MRLKQAKEEQSISYAAMLMIELKEYVLIDRKRTKTKIQKNPKNIWNPISKEWTEIAEKTNQKNNEQKIIVYKL